MNTMFKTLSLAVIGSLITVAGAHAAGFAGASSDENHIIIQPTGSNGPHGTVGGDVGVRVTSATGVFGQATMGLPAYQNFSQNQIVQGYKVSTLNANILPPNHRSLGNFDFAQVPNQEVYFGEWTADRSNPDATHTVYYGGKNKADNLPNHGKATYSIKGINNFDSNNLLTGTLTANFDNSTLHGSMTNEDLTIEIKDNTIDYNNAQFSGNAIAIHGRTSIDGHSTGHFFDNDGKSLAGIATFEDNRELNTAFGGERTFYLPTYSNPYEPNPVLEVKK